MTDYELNAMKVNIQTICQDQSILLEIHGVPIDNESDFDSSLFSAVFALEDLLNKGHVVAVHSP